MSQDLSADASSCVPLRTAFMVLNFESQHADVECSLTGSCWLCTFMVSVTCSWLSSGDSNSLPGDVRQLLETFIEPFDEDTERIKELQRSLAGPSPPHVNTTSSNREWVLLPITSGYKHQVRGSLLEDADDGHHKCFL